MDYFIYLSTSYGKLMYILSYAAAAIFLLTAAIISGKKARYPMSQWLPLLATALLFFIIGNKIFTYSLPDLERIIGFGAPEQEAGKTVMGGIFGMFIGIGIAKFMLGSRFSVLDRVAVSFPIAMAIHRIGCLFSGCCHGIPTSIPWGIKYGPDSHAYHAHIISGSVLPGQSSSLAVHPTQLYQIIGCLIIALIIWKITRKRRSIRGIFLITFILYLWLRFFTEFFRDPLANGSFGEFYYGLKLAQWAVLGAIILASLLLLWKYIRSPMKIKPVSQWIIPGIIREASLTFMLLLLVYLLRNWLDFIEFSVLSLVLFPLVIYQAVRLYRFFTVPGLRLLPALLMLAFLTFSAQQIIRTPDTRIAFTDIEGGITYGYFEHMIEKYGNIGSDCYKVYPQYNTSHNFVVGGASIAYNEYHGLYRKFRLGSSLSFGFDLENKEEGSNETHFMVAINPNFKVDFRWLGLGGGLMFGYMRFEGYQNQVDDGNNELRNDVINYNLYTRLGPYDYFYLTFKRSFLQPTLMMKPLIQMGAGSGLGRVDGRNIEGGLTINGDDPGGYLMCCIPIKNIYEAGFFLGIDRYDNTHAWQYQLALNFRYKFNIRDLPPKVQE